MTDFEKWKERYDKRWATAQQLQRLVTLRVLTQAEYELIVSPTPPLEKGR